MRKSGVTSIKSSTWVTIALLLMSSLILLFHFSTTNDEFSRYNVGWNGTSDFFSTLDRHTTIDVINPSGLAGYYNATLIIIAPDYEITPFEGALYRDFVLRGNTLLLADDSGNGNALLRSLGSTIVIRQGNLTSVDQAYTDAHLIIVTPVRTARFFPVGSSLVLNRAAILTGGEPLLTTTIFSWMDESPDKRKSDVERVLGRYTVMAEEKIGNGTVYVLSDPSIFINGMKDPGALYGNRFFLGEIAHTPGPLLIDSFSSRTGRVQGAGEIIHSVRSNDKYQVMIAALLVAGIVIAWNRRII